MNLNDTVKEYYLHQCRKHDLAPDPEQYAVDQINSMSNNHFLAVLSDALEEMGVGRE
jgi:hypothetical protein